MGTMYQRGKIETGNLYPEHKKDDQPLPLVSVNFFPLKDHGGDVVTEAELLRSPREDYVQQVCNVETVRARSRAEADVVSAQTQTATSIPVLQTTARDRRNVIAALMVVKKSSLAQISHGAFRDRRHVSARHVTPSQ